jgi:hypothetical protein
MWAGCIVSLTTPTRSSLTASRSVSSLSLVEKVEESAHRVGGKAGSDDSANDREANRENRIFEPVVVDVGVLVRKVQSQEKET